MSAAEPIHSSLPDDAADGWERRALDRYVARLRERVGAELVAVYADDECGLQRMSVAGLVPDGEELPVCIEMDALSGAVDGPFAGTVSFPLPGGVVVQRRGRFPGDDELASIVMGLRAARLAVELKRAAFAAKYRGVELEALHDVGLAIASTLDVARIAEEALLRAVSLLDARTGALYVVEDEEMVLQRTLGGEAVPRLSLSDERFQNLGPAALEGFVDLVPGAEHVLAAPIMIDRRLRGLLLVADKETRTGVEEFGSEDFRTLSLFANHTAIALENARLHREGLEMQRLERELDLAADIQRRLLPSRMPDLEGIEATGWNRPARHVGGDYFDVREREDGCLSAVVADVTGKGLPAALLVSTLHSSLRLLADQTTCSSELMARLDRHIAESSASNKFITFLAIDLDPRTGSLEYCNAGHNPGLVIREDGTTDKLCSGNLPLGIQPSQNHEVGRTQIRRGDLVCLFSDGITESEDREGEEFGVDRLAALLAERRTDSLERVLEAIDRAVLDHAAGQPQVDDQTVVLVRCAAEG